MDDGICVTACTRRHGHGHLIVYMLPFFCLLICLLRRLLHHLLRLLTKILPGNAIEMLPIMYFTFTRYAGLYFWSMLIADLAVLVYATGFGR